MYIYHTKGPRLRLDAPIRLKVDLQTSCFLRNSFFRGYMYID